MKPDDVVIAPKLDRMLRSALDALAVFSQLKERRASLRMIDMGGDVTGNGISKPVFTILSAAAGMGVIASRERVATAKSVQKQRGRYLCGKVGFG